MIYVVLVSHGMFAPGLHNALEMLAGAGREDVLSTSLENGMSADTFGENFKKLVMPMKAEDHIILLGDLVGGSPLTTATNILSEVGLLGNTTVYGGMNLPLAVNAVLMKDTMGLDELKAMLIEEGRAEVKEFVMETEENDDDI